MLLVLLTVDFADAKVSLDKSSSSASSTAVAGLGIAGRLVAREVFLVGFGRLVLPMPVRIGECGGEGCTQVAGRKCLDQSSGESLFGSGGYELGGGGMYGRLAWMLLLAPACGFCAVSIGEL